MKKIFNIAIVAAGLVSAVGAFAADTAICTTGTVVVPTSGTAGTHYMMAAIAPKCSANTHVAGTDGTSGAWYAVGSASVKGKSSFGGHTNGGSVKASANCTIPGGCTVGEAQAARTAANTAAASS